MQSPHLVDYKEQHMHQKGLEWENHLIFLLKEDNWNRIRFEIGHIIISI